MDCSRYLPGRIYNLYWQEWLPISSGAPIKSYTICIGKSGSRYPPRTSPALLLTKECWSTASNSSISVSRVFEQWFLHDRTTFAKTQYANRHPRYKLKGSANALVSYGASKIPTRIPVARALIPTTAATRGALWRCCCFSESRKYGIMMKKYIPDKASR
jgi:hypothetical protein